MSHRAKVVHSIAGRMRVKIPAGKRNPHVLRNIKHSLAPIRGIHEIAAEPVTGSLTIHYSGYSPEHFRETLAEHGRATGLYDLAPPELTEVDKLAAGIQQEADFLASRSELARSIVNTTKSLDVALKKATNNNVDLKVLLPLVLAAYTVFEYGAEASTPLWVTLGIFSFNSFVALHPPLPEPPEEDEEAREIERSL